jgi:hypothetical protein
LWLCSRREAKIDGTVSSDQKFTMSSAPTEPTYGMPEVSNTSSLCGPADSTPPTNSSATSVVVRSSTAVSEPDATSFSIDCPPVPVAWKTMQSWLASSSAVAACTQAVVTPNIVSPIAASASAGVGCQARTMPATACAALASTWREMRFSPDTSTTGYSIMMSALPTKTRTSPDASVHTSSLGQPTGNACSAGESSAAAPEPPAPITPPTAAARARR